MKAQIVDGPFRKANYPIFPTLVQVYDLQENPSNIDIINYIDDQDLTEWPKDIGDGSSTALVTAKPTDRRAILEEAANISGLHVRRHEAELRLNAAETNLKRADELRRQQEKQLANLQKQAEEATKYKLISEEIKKIEAGLYYLKLLDIDNEIRIENEINNEAEGEVSNFNQQIAHGSIPGDSGGDKEIDIPDHEWEEFENMPEAEKKAY